MTQKGNETVEESADACTVRGRTWKFGDWISGDDGILHFSELRDFAEEQDTRRLAEMCFPDIDPGFASRVTPGDIVVAGRGFGVPSHPPVPLALLACGIAAVVAESTDSPFIRRSLNVGLPVLPCPGISRVVEPGHELEIDLAQGLIINRDSGARLQTDAFSPMMLTIWRSGGLMRYLEAELERAGTAARPS